MCSGDLCVAINSLGKPAVGGSKRTEVRSYIKIPKSEVKSSHQMLFKVVWPNEQFIFFNIIDLQCTCIQLRILAVYISRSALSIVIHRTVFQQITIHGHQKWLIMVSQK